MGKIYLTKLLSRGKSTFVRTLDTVTIVAEKFLEIFVESTLCFMYFDCFHFSCENI